MKKLVYLLSCLFLLSAGFVACSNDTDDPPEQPSSHQNETPIDSASVEKDTTEVDSTEVPICAQNTHMLADSPTWIYHSRVYDKETYPVPIGYSTKESVYSISDSIEKDGQKYYKLTHEVLDVAAKPGTGQKNKTPVENFSLIIREENGKIYADAEEFQSLYGDDSCMLYEQIGNEFLIYDFTLKEGDSFGADDLFVDRIDVVETMDGLKRKLFVLSSGHEVLEGIGCLFSAGELINYLASPPVEETSIGWKYAFLGSVVKNGDVIYGISSADADMLVTNIKPQQIGLFDSSVYDFSGRRVKNGELHKGVYIQNGKKFVIK